MRVDNIDFFSSEKLQRIIAERFGQSVDLADLNDDSLKIFEQSTREAVKNFERSMGFNSQYTNPKYVENKVLLDYITKEQEKRMKISRVQGDKVELSDPENPGITTTIDTKKMDLDTDEKGQLKVDKKDQKSMQQQKTKMIPGQTVRMEDMDDDAKAFMDHLSSKGYKILSQGGGPNSISIEYQDREGNTHVVDFKHGTITKEAEKSSKDDLEDIVAPEFKKVVHDMQQGMSRDDIKKKYPKAAKTVDQVADDLKKVMEVIRNHLLNAQGQSIDEAGYRMSGRETAALRLLVGSQNFAMARRAMEMARNGQSVPASLMKGFMPILEKLDKFIKGGAGAVNRLNTLSSIVGEDYEAKLKKLLENEMETSEILLASQDIVDQITDMYEKIAELKSSAVLELVDRMSNEMGNEQAQSFQNQINPTLQALEDALGTARQGAQDAVSIVKGEAPKPMAGDGDIDAGDDLELDAGDDMGDADIEGGDDFGASEPAAGGKEPAGRAER